MYRTPAFARARAQLAGTIDHDAVVQATDEGFLVRIERVIPATMVQSSFRGFLPPQLRIIQEEHWVGQRADLTVTVRAFPVTITGLVTLEANTQAPQTTQVTIGGDVIARIPLLSGGIEQAVVQALREVAQHEEHVANTWISSHQQPESDQTPS